MSMDYPENIICLRALSLACELGRSGELLEEVEWKTLADAIGMQIDLPVVDFSYAM